MNENHLNFTLSEADQKTFIEAVKTINTLIEPFKVVLTDKDRRTLPKMSDGTVPFAEKAASYAVSHPEFKPDYVDAMSKLGEIYGQNLGRIDAAEDCFLQAIEVKPNDESSLENLGIVYGIKKDFNKSLSYFQQALKIKPEKYELYMNISQTYRIMGDLKSAQDYIVQAEKYKPKK